MSHTISLTPAREMSMARIIQDAVRASTGADLPLGRAFSITARLVDSAAQMQTQTFEGRSADDALIPEGAPPFAWLTNPICEHAWGDQHLFQALGLGYSTQEGFFYPLTDAETAFISDEIAVTVFGEARMGCTIFWCGRKWYAPFLQVYFDPKSAEAAEAALTKAKETARAVAARVAPYGGHVYVDKDADDGMYAVHILLPMALAPAQANSFFEWVAFIERVLSADGGAATQPHQHAQTPDHSPSATQRRNAAMPHHNLKTMSGAKAALAAYWNHDEDPNYPESDHEYELANRDTRLTSYWEWLVHRYEAEGIRIEDVLAGKPSKA